MSPRPGPSFPLDPTPGPALFRPGVTPSWGSTSPSHTTTRVLCPGGAPRLLSHGPQPPSGMRLPLPRPCFRFKPKRPPLLTDPALNNGTGVCHQTGLLRSRGHSRGHWLPLRVAEVSRRWRAGHKGLRRSLRVAGHFGSAVALPCLLRTGQVRPPPQARPQADTPLTLRPRGSPRKGAQSDGQGGVWEGLEPPVLSTKPLC